MENQTLPDYTIINNLLNERLYPAKFIIQVPSRNLLRWQTSSIIQGKPGEWSKYSLIDILWIGIIQELKNYGFTNDKILNVQKDLFKIHPDFINKQEIKVIDSATIGIITYKDPVFLVCNIDGKAQIIDGYSYIEKLQKEEITNHLIINLNGLVKTNIEGLYKKPNFKVYKGLNKDEIQVLLILRSKNFETIKITKKNNVIFTIEGTESVGLEEERVVEILKQHSYQNIEIVQAQGKIVKIKRTIKKKGSNIKK